MEAISDARAAGVPEAVIDRARVGIVPDELPIDWEGEAIRTISAQNANNSIRVMNRFMELSARDPSTLNWDLTARTTGEVVRSVNAKGLWDSVCRAAWASGDPGLQFGNTINEWNTCRADGEILSSNPCGEYQWLDDTACNLASLRLTAFLLPVGSLDLDAYEHALRIWTVILDISNSMGSFPGRSIAETNIKYRTIGLGYADLGGLLMRLAIPYDSDEGRALAAGLTALMTGVAYRTSAEMAADPRLGPFPRWGTNAEGMWRVLRNHARACGAGRPDISIGYEGLTVRPYEVARDGSELWERARNAWEDVQRSASGFRNAQVSLLAPTGTISFVMDCDTTGVEPDLGLVKRKRLAGGGEDMTIVNRAVPEALRRLGYDERAIEKIVSFVEAEGYLPQLVDSVRSFTGYVDPVHEAVFDCAFPAREGGRSIAPMGHVRMVAAVQPFLSGAVSKTIGLPADATVEDVSRALREAHRFGLKAVAVYRDGSKLTQPLSVGAGAPKLNGEWSRPAADEETLRMYSNGHDTSLPRGVREYLPWRREGRTQKVKIGDHGQSVFMTMNHYPDGRLGEVYFELGHEGSTLRGMAGLFAMAVSVGLQYGVPVREFVDRFTGTKFEPAGIVEGHNRIKIVSSIGDLVGRELGITFLGEERLANTPAPQTEFVVGQGIIGMEHAALKEARSSLTGRTCPRCGALARTTGTCVNCEVCDYEEGCG
jgi:ribonucleoside-diphosphate reductase alpha chain